MKYIRTFLFIVSFIFVFIVTKIITFFLKISLFKRWFPKKKNKILFLENFPVENAGYQYRAKKWSDVLNKNGYSSFVKTTVNDKNRFETLHKKHSTYYLIITLVIRVIQIIRSARCEKIIVRRNIIMYNEYGNLFLEKLLVSIHEKPILDFDDHLELEDTSKSSKIIPRILLENRNKFKESLKYYDSFIVASNYLKKFTQKNTIVIPTCTEVNINSRKQYLNQTNTINFGWIGSNGNQKYLDTVIDALNKISLDYSIKLIVISGTNYSNSEAKFTINNYKWSMNTQIENLLKIDVGLMPLPNNNVSKGKGGFKLIQYMAMGIVSIAKGITINTEIISDGNDGYLYFKDSELYDTIKKVIENYNDFSIIGQKALYKIENNYSFKANKVKLLDFLESKKS